MLLVCTFNGCSPYLCFTQKTFSVPVVSCCISHSCKRRIHSFFQSVAEGAILLGCRQNLTGCRSMNFPTQA